MKFLERPVAVSLNKGGQSLEFASADRPADLLMSVDWPGERDEWHRDTVDACLKVIEGYRSSEDAEKAFRQAADRAGVLLPD